MNSEMCRVGLNICGVSHDVNMPLRLQFEVRSIDLTSDGVSAGSHCLRDCCLCSVNRRSSPAPKHIALACSAPNSCQVISRGNYPGTPPRSSALELFTECRKQLSYLLILSRAYIGHSHYCVYYLYTGSIYR